MTEATGEQIQLQNLTDEQREQYHRDIAEVQRRGLPVTEGVTTAIIRALRQQEPVAREGRPDSPERIIDAVTGKSTVDFLPPELKEQPVALMKRQLTEMGAKIEEWQAEMTLRGEKGEKPYKPPPGEKVKVIEPKKGEKIYKFDINWAEYGWAPAEKKTTEQLLESFGLHGEQRERAMEVLLLAGYEASDVNKKLDGVSRSNETILTQFVEIFSTPETPLPKSSLRIIFNEELRDSEEFQDIPMDMEALAWQMSWAGNAGRLGGKWMVGRENSLFEIRMKTKEERTADMKASGGKDRSWGKYYINEANFREWFLDQTNALYDLHGPDGQIDAMTGIKIEKRLAPVTFRDMLEKQNQLFVSEDQNTQYMQMWLQLQYDESNFLTLYTNDVIYRQASKQGLDKWTEEYEKMTAQNFLTKLGFRSNMLQRLLTGAEMFEEGRAGMHDDKYLSDNRLGTAFLEMALAYYNLGDFTKLQQILGENSSFFTLKGWEAVFKNVADDIKLRPRGEVRLDEDAEKILNNAFIIKDKDGNPTGNLSNTITDRKAFQQFINLLGTKHLAGGYQELLITRAVQLAVQKRYDLKPSAGLSLYAAQAWFINRFMGGMARNDVQMTAHIGKNGRKYWTPNPSVHDKMSELLNLDANRKKYLAEGGGKPGGNYYTLGQFKAAIVDPYNGIATQDGTSIIKIFETLHDLRVTQQDKIDGIKVQLENNGFSNAAIEAHVKQEEVKHSRDYMNFVAKHVQFRDDQQIEYVQVHLKTGKEWAQRVVSGEGLDFSMFTNFDAWGGGATVDRAKFIKEIQKKMIGTLRDMVKKYNYANFDDDIRIPFYDPVTGEHGFHDGKLGEQEFGYDLLNREEFWLEDKDKGGYKKDDEGRHMIDYKKVNKDRVTLMKQMFLMELQADMFSHQKTNSGDVRFPPSYYLNVIDALKKMPGEIIANEFKLHGYTVPEGFWTNNDMKWFEKRALDGGWLGSGKFAFHVKWWFTSLMDKQDKEGLGFGKAFGIMVKSIFSGN